MKSLIVLVFTVINIFDCSPSSAALETGAGVCDERNYRHKSETEVAAMTPAQKIDEQLKENLHHMPAGANDPYSSIVLEYVRKDGIKVLPVLTEIASKHDPHTASRCERMRFFVAFETALDVDNVVIRLRGTKEGRSTIDALEAASARMREARLDNDDHKTNGDYDFYLQGLSRLQGSTIMDGIIRDTLRVKDNVQMSDDELIEFSNFLTSRDPSYPGWSEVGEYAVPMLLQESKRYYEAYIEFKKRK